MINREFIHNLDGNLRIAYVLRHLPRSMPAQQQAQGRHLPRQDSRHLQGPPPLPRHDPHRAARRPHPLAAHQVPGHQRPRRRPHRPDAGHPRGRVALRPGGVGRGRCRLPYPRPDDGADLPAGFLRVGRRLPHRQDSHDAPGLHDGPRRAGALSRTALAGRQRPHPLAAAGLRGLHRRRAEDALRPTDGGVRQDGCPEGRRRSIPPPYEAGAYLQRREDEVQRRRPGADTPQPLRRDTAQLRRAGRGEAAPAGGDAAHPRRDGGPGRGAGRARRLHPFLRHDGRQPRGPLRRPEVLRDGVALLPQEDNEPPGRDARHPAAGGAYNL